MVRLIPEYPPLDKKRCLYWANMAYWDPFSAVLLSMGYDCSPLEAIVTEVELKKKIGKEYQRRHEILKTVELLGQIKNERVPDENDGGLQVVYNPRVFSAWAREKLPSFPPELYDAVMQNCQPSGSENVSPLLFAETVAEHKSAQEKPVVTDQNGEKTQATELKTTAPEDGEIILNGNPGSHARWDKKRKPLVEIAVKFMQALIDMECSCNHEVLSNITYENALDGQKQPLKNHDSKSFNLKGQIKKKAKEMVPECRRFGTDKYDRQACKCLIADHKKFKLSRHRE